MSGFDTLEVLIGSMYLFFGEDLLDLPNFLTEMKGRIILNTMNLPQPTDEEELAEDEGGGNAAGDGRHLCRLAQMDALDSISVVASDFYGHLVFR